LIKLGILFLLVLTLLGFISTYLIRVCDS